MPVVFSIQCWLITSDSKVAKSIITRSDISFAQFKSDVAKQLGILDTSVVLCYKPSFTTGKTLHKELLADQDWTRLVDDARTHRNKTTTRRNGSENAWSFELKEVAEVDKKSKPTAAKVCSIEGKICLLTVAVEKDCG